MKWAELQDSIAQRYCGTVLVLDDEICTPTKEGLQLAPLFLKAKTAFERKGMLCDLRHIDDDFRDHQKTTSINQQLQRADTVVVDWYLGSGMDQLQDPTNALTVLKELLSIGGFRFAIIHSKATPEDVVARLQVEFSGAFKVVLSQQEAAMPDDATSEIVSEDGSPQSSSDRGSAPTTYQLSKSVYLSVIQKSDPPSLAADVTQFFVQGLRAAFPDHLHWAGLEFAARARAELPALLEKLPSSTDVALVFQSLAQSGQDELADCVVECLALELRQIVSQTPLSAVSDETLLSRLASEVQQKTASIKRAFVGRTDSWSGSWQNLDPKNLKASCIEDHEQRFPDSHGSFFPAIPKKRPEEPGMPGLKKQSPELTKFIATALGTENGVDPDGAKSHYLYASIREHLQCAAPLRLETGVILYRERLPNDNENPSGNSEWLLCISPACDCARGDHSRKYLFVGGETASNPGASNACIRCGDEVRFVKWKSSDFDVRECAPTGPAGYTMLTKLHDSFVQKVIQKTWGHQTRVGVSTSDFLRKERGE